MPKTDYGQMLADIHKQLVSGVKKITPELAKKINLIAIELDGEVTTHLKSDGVLIYIDARAGQQHQAMLEIVRKHFHLSDIQHVHAWVSESQNCTIWTKNSIQITAISKHAEAQHAA